MSVSQPKRSFCPTCKHDIRVHENIPILSWIFLRGKCAGCKGKISIRYPFVELLTALLFLAASFHWASLGVAIVFAILFTLLISATFIDIDHYIIPHTINIIGAVLGLGASIAFPVIHLMETRGASALQSILGCVTGMGILWLVVEAGKLAFGKKKINLEKPTPWTISQKDEESPILFQLGEDEPLDWWEDLFGRASDRLILECESCVLDGKTHRDVVAEFSGDSVRVVDTDVVIPLEKLDHAKGVATRVTIPREAMGLGDVWFLGMMGTLLGWKGVLFTVAASSMIGSLIPTTARLFGFGEWGKKIPFGPYLAAGALLWFFFGHPILEWYFGLFLRR